MESNETRLHMLATENERTLLEEWTAYQALLDAANHGRAEHLRCLLQDTTMSASTFDTKTQERFSSIVYAALRSTETHNVKEILHILRDGGWDINAASSWIDPPALGDRRVICDITLVHWFLDHGADPNRSAGKLDITPLSIAVQFAPLKIVELLIQHAGAGPRGQLANYATQRPNHDLDTIPILRLLWRSGVPMDNWIFEDHPISQDHLMCRTTPLMNACYVGDTDVVRFLVGLGVNLRKPIWIGSATSIGTEIPIDIAKGSGAEDIVEILQKAMKQDCSHL
ncbi:hypothetical protein FH972_024051 [Carpinus fangiana]|uniref:Uncharacterized protein n=1 Tax=Carpinus fangiana TaxID=176857 RepID=A0A5N6KXK9_9ROSI|nr:hypothetical protein FH972_024051 [Carpinus fangiana]